MILKELRVKNIKSIGDIAVSFVPSGIIVIEGKNYDSPDFGSNGSAKTALLSSIAIALFGKPLEGGSVANFVRFSCTDFYIYLSFIVDDNIVEIERTLNNVKLKINGKEVKGTKTAINKEIVEITSLTFPAAKAIFSGVAWESFIDMTPSKRIDALERIFGISVFDEIIKDFKRKKSSLETKMNELNLAISHLKGVISSNESSLEVQIYNFEKKRKEKINNILININKLKNFYKVYKDEISTYKESLNEDKDLLTQLNEKEKLLQEHTEQMNELQTEISEIRGLLHKVTSDKNRVSSYIKSLQNNICPLCGNDVVDKELLLKQQRYYKKLETQSNNLLDKLNECTEKLKIITNKHSSIAKEVISLRTKIQERQSVENKINDLRNKIELIKEKLNLLTTELERVKEEENPYEILEEERKKRLESALQKLKVKVSKFTALENDKTLCDEWVNILKKARVIIFKRVLVNLEKRINGYLSYLYPELVLTFEQNDENLEVLISRGKTSIPFKLLSEGEKQVVRLSCLLGLFDVLRSKVGKVRFGIFDEPTQALDLEKRNLFYSLLSVLSKDMQIFCIDHHKDIEIDFSQKIIVEKKNGISYLGGSIKQPSV